MTHDEQIASAATTRAHVWERWDWMWNAIFYGVLVVATVLALIDTDSARPLETAALSALLGGWYWLMVMRVPHDCLRVLPLMVYFAVTIGVWVVLTRLHETYYMLLLSLFTQIFYLLPLRWAVPTTVVLTGLMVLPQFDGLDLRESWPGVVITVTSTVVGTLMAIWIGTIIRQSDERQHLIEQLEATRRDLAAAERQTGVLEERQRLSGEIHDTLAQAFASIVMHLEAADGQLPPEQAAARRHVDQARRAARDGLSESRRLVWALRPEALEQAPLSEALDRLARRWSEESGIAAELIITGAPRLLSPAADVTLLRAAQESLANVRKHARAGSVRLTLSYMEDVVLLDVQDDGVGFDAANQPPPERPDRGFGLRAMRERVEQIGGALTVESARDEGTTVVVALPA